jgi:hypothetical protein
VAVGVEVSVGVWVNVGVGVAVAGQRPPLLRHSGRAHLVVPSRLVTRALFSAPPGE